MAKGRENQYKMTIEATKENDVRPVEVIGGASIELLRLLKADETDLQKYINDNGTVTLIAQKRAKPKPPKPKDKPKPRL